MAFPDWFDRIPRISVYDPLAALLGSATDGKLEYGYVDAVRLCGHSCPTVASAWLMASGGLRTLWPNETPTRGGVRLDFAEARQAGVTGVTAAVFSLLTGASDEGGFKGLAGRFDRRLSHFSAQIPLRVRMTRLDNGQALNLDADPARVAPDPGMAPLMNLLLNGRASPEQQSEFGRLWQDRVRRILFAGEEVVRILPVQ